MLRRLRLLRLVAAALALATHGRPIAVCASSTAASSPGVAHSVSSGRNNSRYETTAKRYINRQKRARQAGDSWSNNHGAKSSSSSSIPWLTSMKALRGGGRRTGSSAVDPRSGAGAVAFFGGLRRSAKICGLFSLSYLCSVMFNVNNKRALLLVPLPWTYAMLNLSIGSAVALASWSIKISPWPRITRQDVGVLLCMGSLHAVSHLTVILGLGAGAVSFLQTVKASEACFTALLSFLFLGQTLPLPVYLTLLPVVVGVALTCCGQGLRFSWVALLAALVSNLSNALRNVLIKKSIGPAAAVHDHHRHRHRSSGKHQAGTPAAPRLTGYRHFQRPTPSAAATAAAVATASTDSNLFNSLKARKFGGAAALANTRAGGATGSGLADLAPGDTYRLLTLVGAAVLIPAAAYFERDSWPRLWRGVIDAASAFAGQGGGGSSQPKAGDGASVAGVAEAAMEAAARGDWAEAVRRAVLSGVCFNLFYDLTFRLLEQLHPVTHAVGNTIKRIVVIGAGAFVFGGDLGGAKGALGSGLAIVGVLAYSLAKARCDPMKDLVDRRAR